MLTQHQQEKVDELCHLLKTQRTVVLQGSAGVGKTYLIDFLLGQLNIKRVMCAAPTHKALNVIREKINTSNVEFSTVHSALKLKRRITNDGKETFSRPKNVVGTLSDFELLIVDESSMINRDLLTYLLQEDIKIIFIGDSKQINPIGESDSIVFTKGFPTVTLTEIVRQAKDNPIIDLSYNLDKLGLREDRLTEGKGYRDFNNYDVIIQKLAEVNGTDDLKYLAWTNKEVDKVNADVRKLLYTNPKKVHVDETIVLNGPFGSQHTNEEVWIATLEEKELGYTLRYYDDKTHKYVSEILKIKVYLLNKATNALFIIHEDSEKEFERVRKQIYKDCKLGYSNWKGYYEFIEMFTSFKYNHALSVHKSQGSTFKSVVLNVGNIKLNRKLVERNRLLYTGITRASTKLLLYNT